MVKWYIFQDGLTLNRTDGPCSRDDSHRRPEDVAAGDARLEAFVRDIDPKLAYFLPGADAAPRAGDALGLASSAAARQPPDAAAGPAHHRGRATNFMKVAPLWHALVPMDLRRQARPYRAALRSQHVDAFFRDLGLPEPHHHRVWAAAAMPSRRPA